MKIAGWEIEGEWHPFTRFKRSRTVRATPFNSSGRGAHDDAD
jgi:hypothetical protein